LNFTKLAYEDITLEVIVEYKLFLEAQKFAERTIDLKLNFLKFFFEWLHENDFIKKNPTASLERRNIYMPKVDLSLSDLEMQKIITATKNSRYVYRDYPLIIMLSHGLRASEVLNLNLSDWDGQRLRIGQAKAGSTGYVPIEKNIKYIIDHYVSSQLEKHKDMPEETPMFFSVTFHGVDRSRLTYNGLRNVIARIGKSAKIDFHAHQLRHTFATNLILSGMNPYHAMTLTRHKSKDAFKIYTVSAEQKAAEADFYVKRVDK
jgi:integrase/recombinase XerD